MTVVFLCSILQLLITIVFQFFVMRDLEKLAGTLRIGIIYVASGVAGSLSSAIFLPYHVEVGHISPYMVSNWAYTDFITLNCIKIFISSLS